MAGKANTDDFLAELTRQLAAVAPELGPERLGQIARDIRHVLGGTRPYIPKQSAAAKARTIDQARSIGADLQTAFRCAEVSRSTGYRLIRRK